MYKLRVYQASHEERPNKGTGTREEHASQHRPTTHPPLGVPLQLASSPGPGELHNRVVYLAMRRLSLIITRCGGIYSLIFDCFE